MRINGRSKIRDITKDEKKKIMIVFLYVDDMIYTRNLMLKEFQTTMKEKFEMTDLGLMKYFLGLEVEQYEHGIFISQKRYASDVLKRFKKENCKPVNTLIATGNQLSKFDQGVEVNSTLYKILVGTFMYLTPTRNDIMYDVSVISRFLDSPKYSHWKYGKKNFKIYCSHSR